MKRNPEPTLFPLVDDARPAAGRDAAQRYQEPDLFSGDRPPAPRERHDGPVYRIEYRVSGPAHVWLSFVTVHDRAEALVIVRAQQQRRADIEWRISP